MARRGTLKRYGYTALVASIVARFSPLLHSPSRLTKPNGQAHDRQWLGDYGERVAAAWLRSQGCKILAKNYRSPRRGEVDIIARDGKLLLFTEVKTRRTGAKIRGLDAVGKDKQRLIERGANSWLKRLGTREIPWRFDVIEVTVEDGEKPQIHRVENAF
jgi:putative endonuclease